MRMDHLKLFIKELKCHLLFQIDHFLIVIMKLMGLSLANTNLLFQDGVMSNMRLNTLS